MHEMWVWDYPNFAGMDITYVLLAIMLSTLSILIITIFWNVKCGFDNEGMCEIKKRIKGGVVLALIVITLQILAFITALYVLVVGSLAGWDAISVSDLVLSLLVIIDTLAVIYIIRS